MWWLNDQLLSMKWPIGRVTIKMFNIEHHGQLRQLHTTIQKHLNQFGKTGVLASCQPLSMEKCNLILRPSRGI